ncbi:MAG: DUF493 domain-containing protein [Ghiorsea sp.]
MKAINEQNDAAIEETLMTFPCSFPFKVMGINHADFQSNMLLIIAKHIPNMGTPSITSKPSKTGKYAALTVTFTAESKAQLDSLYQEIHAHPDVRMVL